MSKPVACRAWRSVAGWTGGVAVNLVVPLPVGAEFTRRDAWLGIGLAIVSWWAVGVVVCLRSVRLGPVLIRGSYWVALTQPFPILQVLAGIGGILFWIAVSERRLQVATGPEALLGGFVVTLMTAIPLLVAAFLFGGGLRLFRAPPATEQAADYA